MSGRGISKRGERGGYAANAAGSTDEGSKDQNGPDRLAPGLYLAATPIGAANDVTLRALDALARADVIAAEDTRRARQLMTIHGIEAGGRPIIPYHDHNGGAQRPKILARIEAGESVVCVSDAGTPLIADPGWRLAKDAIERDLPVTALPGASALLAALAIAGLPTDRFLFAGFLAPKRGARLKELTELKDVPATLVFYESPRRLGAALADMRDALGGAREAAVCRELTKLHEEARRGTLETLADAYAEETPRGEIVLCVGPPRAEAPDEAALDEVVAKALKTMSPRDAARFAAETLGVKRKDAYDRALSLKGAE
ncbi:MAG: 16S rRNA (cytidine(1402)-2'-O)-methyltransferase [Pseudomonadota bacterium]